MSFTVKDLEGIWIGSISGKRKKFRLRLTVDVSGMVSGSGVQSVWSIDQNGVVTGEGSFSFIEGSNLSIASSRWILQLNNRTTHLSGSFSVDYPGFQKMRVNLRKR